MKVNAVHALVNLLVQQTSGRNNAADRNLRTQVLTELLSETKDARQRLVSLERMLREANVIGAADSLAEPAQARSRTITPDLAPWKAASATLDAINKQETQISGRTWEGEETGMRVQQEGSARPRLDAEAAPPREAPPGPRNPDLPPNPFAATAANIGVAERFEPTIDDIEKALLTLGVPPLSPAFKRKIEDEFAQDEELLREQKYRFMLIASGMAILFFIALMISS